MRPAFNSGNPAYRSTALITSSGTAQSVRRYGNIIPDHGKIGLAIFPPALIARVWNLIKKREKMGNQTLVFGTGNSGQRQTGHLQGRVISSARSIASQHKKS